MQSCQSSRFDKWPVMAAISAYGVFEHFAGMDLMIIVGMALSRPAHLDPACPWCPRDPQSFLFFSSTPLLEETIVKLLLLGPEMTCSFPQVLVPHLSTASRCILSRHTGVTSSRTLPVCVCVYVYVYVPHHGSGVDEREGAMAATTRHICRTSANHFSRLRVPGEKWRTSCGFTAQHSMAASPRASVCSKTKGRLDRLCLPLPHTFLTGRARECGAPGAGRD